MEDAADLAWVVFAGGAVGDPGGAAIDVLEDDFITLDDELTDAACITATSNEDKTQSAS